MSFGVETSDALLVEGFDADRIGSVRHLVGRCAASVGLCGQRLEDFTLAVSEVITNAVRHAGGHGQLRMWLQQDSLRCAVTDQGDGIPPDQLAGHQLPPSSATSGRGLWLARHLCDRLSVETGPGGTTVTVCTSLT